MIDAKLRKELSQDIRRLVTGRASTDEFDAAYFDRYAESSDHAVENVAEFGYSLYNSDVLWPYRLKGRRAVDRATRRTAARCVLFLRSGREYEWPNEPSAMGARMLWGLLFSLGMPGGIAILICTIPPLAMELEDVEFLRPLAVAGAVLLAVSLWYAFGRTGYRSICESPAWKHWRSSGNFDVWPFLQREDFDRARRTCFLLDAR